jgi:LacI family transcriptional regulator
VITSTASTTLEPVCSEPGKPLYVITREAIKRAIDTGQYEPGQRIPSTAEMSRQLNVSLVTAHRALGDLVNDGVLHRHQGRGTFVRETPRSGNERPAAVGRIGLVVHRESSLADHFHGQLLEGIRQGARAAYLDLMLLRFGDDLNGECDGFLWVNPLPGEVGDMLERSAPRPCVIAGARVPPELEGDVAAVDADNFGLATKAAEHLLELGHRRLGYVGGGDGEEATFNTADRWRGFLQACEAGGVTLTPEDKVDARSWRLNQEERAGLVEMLRRDDRPTAIFAAGYYHALDVYAAAAEVGLKLPDDLSVIGVDDPPSAEHLSPPLTAVRQPLVRLGRAAVDALVSLRQSDGKAKTLLLDAELVVRVSTCPPAS